MFTTFKFEVRSSKDVAVTVTSPTGKTTVNYHTTNGQEWVVKPDTDTEVPQTTEKLKSDKLKPAQFEGFYKAFFSTTLKLIPTLMKEETQFDFTGCPAAFLKAGPFEYYARTNDQSALKDILHVEQMKLTFIDFTRIKTAYNYYHFFAGLKNRLGQLLHRDSLGIAYLREQYEHVKNEDDVLFIPLKRVVEFVNSHIDKSKDLMANQTTLMKKLNETNDHVAVRELAAQLHHLSQQPEMKQIFEHALSRAIKEAITNYDGNKINLIKGVLEQAALQKAPERTQRLNQ